MRFYILVSVLSFGFSAFAQKQDVEVYEKKEGDKVIVMARNTGTCDYKVKVTITSEGMDVNPSSVIEVNLPAGFMKEMATITPRPGTTWSYGYDVTITQLLTKAPATPSTPASPKAPTATKQTTSGTTTLELKEAAPVPTLSTADIILYAKPGCGRCTLVKNQFVSLGIKHEEVNTQSSSPEVANMWAQLRNQGFSGGSVTMPVIRVNGKYHYDIKNLQEFVDKLKG